MKTRRKGKKLKIYIFSPRLIIKSTNDKYMYKEPEKSNYDKVKYQ